VHPNSPLIHALNPHLNTPISREASFEELLRRPEMDYSKLMQIEGFGPGLEDPQAAEQVQIQVKYSGYIQRQQEEINKAVRNENTGLPLKLDYKEVPGLSNEVIAKLNNHKPETIGQASRISGITPAAISILLVHLKKRGLLRKSA
jgi:tRNA uridine 5-carboxymethylaminomethyl modification enzyme